MRLLLLSNRKTQARKKRAKKRARRELRKLKVNKKVRVQVKGLVMTIRLLQQLQVLLKSH